MMQHPSTQSPPIRLPRLGLGFTRSLAGAMWKSRACALCFSSYVSSDCVFFLCFNVECLHHARYSGPVEAGSRVAQKTMLRFTWQLVAGEVKSYINPSEGTCAMEGTFSTEGFSVSRRVDFSPCLAHSTIQTVSQTKTRARK